MTGTRTHPRLRYAAAALLVVVAAVSVLLWRGTAGVAVTASLQAADQGPAGGTTVTAHPDPWFVYTENGDDVTSVTVTTSDGTRLPVTPMSHRFTYGPHREGQEVGRFEVPVGMASADLRVAVSLVQGGTDVTIAVTTFDVSGFEPWVLWGGLALLLANTAGAVALAAPARSRNGPARSRNPADGATSPTATAARPAETAH